MNTAMRCRTCHEEQPSRGMQPHIFTTLQTMSVYPLTRHIELVDRRNGPAVPKAIEKKSFEDKLIEHRNERHENNGDSEEKVRHICRWRRYIQEEEEEETSRARWMGAGEKKILRLTCSVYQDKTAEEKSPAKYIPTFILRTAYLPCV